MCKVHLMYVTNEVVLDMPEMATLEKSLFRVYEAF